MFCRVKIKEARISGPLFILNGGGERIRTDDPLLAKQVLYQLSYTPIGLMSLSNRVYQIFIETQGGNPNPVPG